ncbi:MAG TPA: V-type ATPase 116kDa subunit family protein [Kofleriaceae bacterium]|nr:V-type ATPase 116kDa subunit family protein [Kofleriaceae bacterium]
MARLRIMGPRPRLGEVLATLQRVGLVHLTRAMRRGGVDAGPGGRTGRRALDAAARASTDLEAIVTDLERLGRALPAPGSAVIPSLPRAVHLARRTRRQVARLCEERQRLVAEQALLSSYRRLLAGFEPLAGVENASAFLVVLRRGSGRTLDLLQRRLREILGPEHHVSSRSLDTGETGVLLLAPPEQAGRIEALLSDVRADQVPLPPVLGTGSLAAGLPRLDARLAEVDRALAAVDEEVSALLEARGGGLAAARQGLHDAVLALEAQALVGATDGAFVLEGWLPAAEVSRLTGELERAVGRDIAVELVSEEDWKGEEAPVVLKNPRLFRPFEAIVKMMPLPRYGTVDPTPFVAIFFPLLFGLAVGDIGYGVVLVGLALLLRARSQPESTLRSVAEIAGACASFTIIFGIVFGELFGDLGHRMGMRPLGFDRAEALVAFLLLAVALGAVHLLIGLGLGIAGSLRREPRKAAGRGVEAIALLLVIVAILAAVRVLPRGLFTPAVVAVLAAFPLLVVLEGIAAPLELMSTLGRVLSYARVMAIGTASILLAAVANRMVGWIGSALVGALFALLFHLVNFAITLLSPTIHVLRLHYVEFFGTFYSPGGTPYRPLARWTSPPSPHGSH